jgi:hypothetical protein
MDGLQNQINELEGKVDRLYELVERISDRISAIGQENPHSLESELAQLPSTHTIRGSASYISESLQLLADHKDILIDDERGRPSLNTNSEQSLSSDLQIRRLTAQLTAAYNRIAALEEQLLSRRMNS